MIITEYMRKFMFKTDSRCLLYNHLWFIIDEGKYIGLLYLGYQYLYTSDMLIINLEMHLFYLFLVSLYVVDARKTYRSIFGLNRYTEWQIGSLNVILSVPHGGYHRASSLPNRRRGGCYIDKKCIYDYECYPPDYYRCPTLTGMDWKTQELSQELAHNLETLTTDRPHVIINHLYRAKLDPNRAENQATFGNECSKRAYKDFHKFITAAKALIDGPGLLLDIHGQSHPEGWLELGYAISRNKLNSGNFKCSFTSIETLAKRECGMKDCKKECLSSIVRGESSFGNHVMSEIPEINVVPSSAYPCPGNRNYYSGMLLF